MEHAGGDKTTVHVRRAISGNEESLAWVVARLSPLLVAQASYRLGKKLRSRYEPEDVVQEAWLVALGRLEKIEPAKGRYTPTLLRFLSTTILHQVSNLARKALFHLMNDSPPAGEGRESRSPDVTAVTTSVVAKAIKSELRGLVALAIEELEEKDREVLILRGIEQLPNTTVAEMLDLTPPGVSMRYSRALTRLRTHLPDSVFSELEDPA